MGFRTVVIKSRVKLELRLNFLVIRGEVEKKIFLNEINTVIIQSTAVSLTAALLNELAKNNIKVVFCDEKCSPSAELIPYYGAHNTAKRYKQQIGWSELAKQQVWRAIITRKIYEQSKLLSKKGFLDAAAMLAQYASDVSEGDVTNREGHAAKVYFNTILPEGDSRRNNSFINGCLNYGYSILLSAFNRETVAAGYLTQLGIWHDNEFNQFNLSCDLMEPLRPIVDYVALSIEYGDKNFKKILIDILNYNTKIDGQNTTLDIAIKRYSLSVFRALNSGDENEITFIDDVIYKDE